MVRFDLLTTVLIKPEAIWYMMPSWLVHNYWTFGGFSCIHHKGLCSL